MAKKVSSRPMEEILTRLKNHNYFEITVFDQDMIVNQPIDTWPLVDCLISFYSKDFPLSKAQAYAAKFNPFLINDLEKQWDIMDRTKVYQTLREAGIELPRFAIKLQNGAENFVEQDDQIEIDGQVFTKPFVEKPINADDHNIYIYFPTSAGGGSQRLFRKVNANILLIFLSF
jgi:inositol hexakisphosphate/diphosphoinositol-pentakisphosphate kinase